MELLFFADVSVLCYIINKWGVAVVVGGGGSGGNQHIQISTNINKINNH